MPWIDPPLAGRNGLSRSSPQLPPLVQQQRSGTPCSSPAQSHGNFQDLLPNSSRRSKENDRGMTAAAWSRRLPYGMPSQALRRVRTHLSPVEDAMLARNTSKLEKAVEEASNGNKYLKTVSVVRRSRSVPAMQRHALETALASHIVRAKVELDKWHLGIVEINELRRGRNAHKLKEKLASWQFAEDDPIVVDAREDLARWRYIEEHMPRVLKQAVEERDMETIRSNLKQLSISGPASIEGAREARTLLRQYESQARALDEGVATRNVAMILTALENWDFPEDARVAEGRATLERREEQERELKMVVASERVNGGKLVSMVTAWEFEQENEDFARAVEVLQGFRMECEGLEEVLRQDPVNLLQLRIVMDSWSFATDPDSCTALQAAVTLLTNYEKEIRSALANSDGFAVRELLIAGSDGQALGNQQLIAEANELQSRYVEASNSLLELVRTAPNLEVGVKDEIVQKCEKWTFAESDPVFELGRAWLRLHASAAECSGKELEEVSRGGFLGPVLGALSREQSLPVDSKSSTAAKSAVDKVHRAWQAAGALAFGVAPSQLPDGQKANTLEPMMQELRGADVARQNCTADSIREVKAFANPPDALHGLFQVVLALLAGSSSWKPAKDDTSWKACQEMISEARKFYDHLGEVPVFVCTGRRSGIVKARDLDAKMRTGAFASCWSVEGMGQMSSVCQHLFSYMECIFRYDELVTANFAPAPEEAKQVPQVAPNLEAPWRTFQARIQDLGGLPDSRQLAVLFLTYGGEVVELKGCEERAMSLLKSANERMLKLQQKLEGGSLLQRLELLYSRIRVLPASSLSGAETKHLVKAASYFAFEGQPSKKIDATLKVFVEFLKDASVFVREATSGKRPQNRRIAFCERKIQARMLEWAELPMYQFTVVSYHLKRFGSASEGEAAVVFNEFLSVLQKIYDEFMPLYLSWSASAQSVEELEDVCRSAGETASFGQQLQGGVFTLEPAAVLDQLESLCGLGLVAAGPHMEAVSKAAACEVAKILECPDLTHPAQGPRRIEKLLAAHLSPVLRAGEVLERLGKQLATPGAMPQEVSYLGPVYQLMAAVFRIFAKPGEPDIEFAEAKQLLQQPKLLTKRLAAWQPLRDGQVKQLQRSQTLLVRLWSVFREGGLHRQPSHDERHRALFAWASLATSLIPLLSTAQALAPVHAAVKAAADETNEDAAWLQVRKILHRPDEPWWWLRLIGCGDPKGYYVRNGLALDAAATLPEASSEPVQQEQIVVPGVGPEAEKKAPASPAVAPEGNRPADESYTFGESPAANDDDYEFDEDREVPGTQPPERDAYSHNFDESAAEQDPYSGAFDAEGESPDRDAAASAALSPHGGAYSQDDFEFENDRSQKDFTADADAEFEADFEQPDADQRPDTDQSEEPLAMRGQQPLGMLGDPFPGGPLPQRPGTDQTFTTDDADDADGQAGLDSRYSAEGFEFEKEEETTRQQSKYSSSSAGEFEFEADDPPKVVASAAGAQAATEGYDMGFEEDEFEQDD